MFRQHFKQDGKHILMDIDRGESCLKVILQEKMQIDFAGRIKYEVASIDKQVTLEFQ